MTSKPLRGPVATPIFAPGQRDHQRATTVASVEASNSPWVLSGILPPTTHGNTGHPLDARNGAALRNGNRCACTSAATFFDKPSITTTSLNYRDANQVRPTHRHVDAASGAPLCQSNRNGPAGYRRIAPFGRCGR